MTDFPASSETASKCYGSEIRIRITTDMRQERDPEQDINNPQLHFSLSDSSSENEADNNEELKNSFLQIKELDHPNREPDNYPVVPVTVSGNNNAPNETAYPQQNKSASFPRRNYAIPIPEEDKAKLNIESKKKGRKAGSRKKATEAAKKKKRKEDNKEAAKLSRKRKKLYIDYLEKKVIFIYKRE